LAALCILFALTIVAPQSWQRRHVAPTDGDAARGPATLDDGIRGDVARRDWRQPAKPELVEPAPALPPLAGFGPALPAPTFADPELVEPAPTGPTVAPDDYLAVDEPLVEPAGDVVLPTPETTTDAEAPPSAVAESFAQRPGGRSVLVRNVPAPDAPTRPAVSVETLVRARDAVVAWVHKARAMAPAAPPQPAPMRVVVESENDRLAMVPDLADPAPLPSPVAVAAVPTELEPDLAPSPADAPGQESDLASDLVTPALKHRPTALLAQLEALVPNSAGAAWAHEVLMRLEPMIAQPNDGQSWQPTLAELRQLAAEGMSDSLNVADPADQSAWLRAARALERRLPIWNLLLDAQAIELVEGRSPAANDAALLESIHEAAALTAGTEAGAGWRTYLRLDDLAGLTSVGGEDYAEARRAAARDVLTRMTDAQLTAEQRMFLSERPWTTLNHDLRPWASGLASLDALSAVVERYELAGAMGDAATIAELRSRMKWSGDPRLEALADHLNRNYRNGNLRVAVSDEFINRMIPPQQPKVAPVRDTIAGAEVRGRSRTKTTLHLRLLPDPTVWRFGLEVQGTVNSQTYSDVGAARVRNSSHMQYEARKLIMINRHGLHVWPAEAKVRGRNSLVGVDSHLGPVPIVGPMVDEMIRETHRQSEATAMAQARAKVKRQACQRMDREADVKLDNLEQRFRTEALGPLDRLSLVAEPLDMSTTENRCVMRVRLADEPQLAAHTPRPSAPSDSFVSVQVHESAINNAIAGLGLDGRRITVGELHKLLGEKIVRHASEPPADLPARAVVEFARHDAARVRCHGDTVELVLSIVELRKGRDSIKSVGVHAFFRPEIDGLEVKLVREGTLQFEGAHLRTGPRLVLHSVFGKLLRKDQQVPLLARRLDDDPRFAGMMVTQLVVDDGWFAMSLGPAAQDRVAWRTRVTR
jgi:hypothetical protein